MINMKTKCALKKCLNCKTHAYEQGKSCEIEG